jgi:tetratricopeptide (TPR) repeat protein
MAQRSKTPPHSKPGGSRSFWWLAVAVGGLLVLAGWWQRSRDREARPAPAATASSTATGSSPKWQPQPSDADTFAHYAGTATCLECHRERHHAWSLSNHAFAEREPSDALDRAAFDPPREWQHGSQAGGARADGDQLVVRASGPGNEVKDFPVVRVIGHDPLRQFLVDIGDGRLQALEASYDPHRNEWFNVYGEEDRRPGEWGHWTGRGMNWNAMCAACHNTRLRKNYDAVTDSYHTAMAERTVSCESCHGPMKDHVLAYKTGTKPVAVSKPTREQILHTCASCHSRRAELTGDFQPGEDYFDHHHLTVPDLSDTYFADGQVSGENYVFGSFVGSRMHAAGVHCLDCHDAHTTKLILPGNNLCLRCHNGGYPNSPKIDPVAHSFHAADSPGNQCVNCHMPHTTYMQRHPRRDHGFTIPDPLLTKQHGIPNACNRCHTDQDADWALAAVEKNYGDKMNRHSRGRAQAIARARAGDATAKAEILRLLTGDDTAYWKAVAANVIDPWLADADVQQALIASLADTNALLRAHASFALAPAAQAGGVAARTALRERLNDPSRGVRINAAWGLREEVAGASTAGRELEHFLNINADQPTGQLQLGTWHLARNNPAAALQHFQRAVAWDPFSAPIRHELAVLYSQLNRPAEALAELQAAVRLAPGEAEFHYKLGLAWNESGELGSTIQSLERAVELDARHARAWYNLGLARQQAGLSPAAIDALFRAESLTPEDARVPFARGTIHAQLGQLPEARTAAERTLSLDPGFSDARRLLEALRQPQP